MNFSPTEERALMIDTAKRFVEQHCSEEMVARWDEEGAYPEDLYQRIAEIGWLGLMVPPEWGGTGTIEDMVAIYEILGSYSTDIPGRIALTAWGQQNLLQFGTDDQRRRLLEPSVAGSVKFSFSLTEPEAGSDAASLRTTATRDGDQYVISGQKVFASAAKDLNNVLIVAARTSPVGEGPRQKGISLLLVPNDAPGLELRRMKTVGRHILGTYEAFFDEVRVPADALLGPEGEGWHCITAHLERERITLAAAYLGAAGTVVRTATQYANERVQFGRPIGKKQAIQHMLADMATKYEAGRWLTYNAAWRYANDLPCRKEASMAKLYVSEMLAEIATTGMQVLGGHGYTYDHHMQRYWRDGRNGTVGGGTSQIQRDLIARELGL